MKRLIWVVIAMLLLSGCTNITRPYKQLNVNWRTVSESESVEGMKLEMKEQYYGSVSRGSLSYILVEADINGDTSGEFEFEIITENPYEKIANNILRITPEVAEKGNIAVSSQGLGKIVDYEIFPVGQLDGDFSEPFVPVGFDFKTGKKAVGEKRDMWMYGSEFAGRDIIVHAIGVALKLEDYTKTGDYWEDFAALNNLHEYDFEEITFNARSTDVLVVKCQDGYAVVKTKQSGWLFMYKYSETGIFD